MKPNFENPAEAARAWADEYEARIAAEKARDEAVTARGQISTRREATALARVMLANREIGKLKATQQATPEKTEAPLKATVNKGFDAINSIAKNGEIGLQVAAPFDAFKYATVADVVAAADNQIGYDWHQLRRWCNKYKVKPLDVVVNGEDVKAWPAAAWKAVFGVDIAALRESGVLV